MELVSLKVVVLVLLASAVALGDDDTEAHEKPQDPYLWIKFHGWLMWGSFGLLMPLGTLIVRFSRAARESREAASQKVQMIFYAHVCVQSISLLVSTAGVVVSFKNFSNQFMHTHQRLGLALWALGWLQPFIGLVRPRMGLKARPAWFIIHWLVGTAAIILSFFNVYNGLRIYELITQESQRHFNILFSVQVAVMAVIYLLQDKWNYVKEQGKSANKPVVAPAMIRQYSVSSHRKYYTAA